MRFEKLRSPSDKVGGIVYFGRMLDKIRLKSADQLPADYVQNLGTGFDGRCLRLLGISYEKLQAEVKPGISDEAVLEKCFQLGRKPNEEEIEIWNEFMRKRGWNDEASELVKKRKKESGFEDRDDIVTMFAYIDADEGLNQSAVEERDGMMWGLGSGDAPALQ
jgi:gluconokinase